MNFAKKLRDVVASNFIEIAKADEAPTQRGAEEEPKRPQAVSAVGQATTTAAAVSAPVPLPSVSAPKADWAEQDLTEFVGADGTVDFARVLAAANLPRVGFTAEKVAKILAVLPSDLPFQKKQLTLQATLNAADRNAVVDPQDVVADAMLKKMHVGQYRDALRAHVETLRQENSIEIARLQAEIDRLKAVSETAEQKRRAGEATCEERMALMERVVVFFQSEVPGSVATSESIMSAEEEEEDELPPFMREDAVFRMLGLENKAAEPGEQTPEESVATADKSPKRSGRFAVADNV